MPNRLTDKQRRAAAVTLVLDAGWAVEAAAKRYDLTARTLRVWVRRGQKGEPLTDKPRSGRPVKLSKKELLSTYRKMHGRHGRSARWASEVALKRKVTRRTVQRRLRALGKVPHRRTRIPLQRPGDAAKRVRFARKYLRHNWRKVWFCDWKYFSISPHLNTRNDIVWGEPGEMYFHEEQKFPPSVMFIGFISWKGRGPIVPLEGTLTGEKYVEILKPILPKLRAMYPDGDWQLLQDNDSKQTSAVSVNFLRKSGVKFFTKAEYPARSPDFNPIEHVWAWMDEQIKGEQLKRKADLLDFIPRLWRRVPLDFVKKSIDNLPSNLQKAIDQNGVIATKV